VGKRVMPSLDSLRNSSRSTCERESSRTVGSKDNSCRLAGSRSSAVEDVRRRVRGGRTTDDLTGGEEGESWNDESKRERKGGSDEVLDGLVKGSG